MTQNALDAFRAGDLKVVGGVSHDGEPTLGLCLASLNAMNGPLAAMKLASGLRPMCASFNACLDFACDQGADILFHTASDVIVHPDALHALLARMDLAENYLTVARGHDPMFGEGVSVGIWIWNMRLVGKDFRFRDVFKQDLDLCERIEAATGKSRTYTDYSSRLGQHHPIWTPFELYSEFIYSYHGHEDDMKNDMRNFLKSGLELNPDNKTLLAGQLGLKRADAEGAQQSSKSNERIGAMFREDTAGLHLDGTEYYCNEARFIPYAMRALGSYKTCVASEEKAATAHDGV